MLAILYELWVVDQNFTALAKRLNRHGFTTEGGLPWSGETVRQLMDQGFAAGLIRVHDHNCDCRNAPRCQRKILLPAAHKPLISSDLWDRFSRLRAGKVTRPARSLHQFTGFIRCWHCCGGMHFKTGTAAFICGSRSRHDEVVCGSRHRALLAASSPGEARAM
ncbi:recombinase family protein [Sphaerisporangium sp. NPDC049003]